MLYPVVQFLVKVCLGQELDSTYRIIHLSDDQGRPTYRLTEVEYLHFLYNEGRSTRPSLNGLEQETYIVMGRRGGSSTLATQILKGCPESIYLLPYRKCDDTLKEYPRRVFSREEDLRGRHSPKVISSGPCVSWPAYLAHFDTLVGVDSVWLNRDFADHVRAAKSQGKLVLQVPTWESNPQYGHFSQLVERSVYAADL